MNNLLIKFKETFLENKREIYEAIGMDFKEQGLEIKYSELEEVFNKIDITSNLNNETKTILAIYNGNICLMLEIALKCLLNNNNLILIAESDESKTRSELVSIIKKALIVINSQLVIKEYADVDIDNILEENELVDRIVFFGDKRKYRQIKNNTSIPIMYNGYGEIIVYVDDEDEFEDELIDIEEYAFENNFYIYKFMGNIDDEIDKINKDGKNDLSIILSNSDEKIIKFMKQVNSNIILVNEVNFNVNHEIPNDLFSF